MTLYVAAADATAQSKARADYTCTGVDDQVQIVAAFNALPAGGCVQLSEGAFYLSAGLAFGAKPLQLVGAGRAATVLRFAFAEPADAVTIAGYDHLLADVGLVNDGLVRYGVLVGAAAYNVLERLAIIGPDSAGIRAETGNSQNALRDVRVRNSGGYGFHIYGQANTLVNCIASREDVGGLAAFRIQGGGVNAHGLIADRHDTGIEICQYAEGVNIHGVHLERCARGILVASSEPVPHGTSITGGMIINCTHETDAAVHIRHGQTVLIQGLHVKDTASGCGFDVEAAPRNVLLIGNQVDDETAYRVAQGGDVRWW